MNAKSFLFVCAWMQPLKALPLEQRWNVLEAIVKYSMTGALPQSLELMETIAFGFIRNEIDRMQTKRADMCERRRDAASKRWKKDQKAIEQANEDATEDTNDANACKVKQEDAPFDIESVSESESKSESDIKSTTTATCVRARGNAGEDSPELVNMNAIPKTSECIITEGEMDALSFAECDRQDVVSQHAGAKIIFDKLASLLVKGPDMGQSFRDRLIFMKILSQIGSCLADNSTSLNDFEPNRLIVLLSRQRRGIYGKNRDRLARFFDSFY